MGEIAEMMLEGILCEGCGEVMDDMVDGATSPGYPRRCAGCGGAQHRQPQRSRSNARKAARHNRERREAAMARKPHACDQCSKLCHTEHGLAEHKRVKHPAPT